MPANYDAKAIEPEVIDFWEKNKVYAKAKQKGKGRKPFYFLQGPPYTSGRIHIGTAWNNCLKDMVLRYKRMSGFNVWDRAGYDMHGLPTENAVQKKLGLKTKDEIEKYGMDKFIKECLAFSKEGALVMNKDLWRLGVWMDYENAYWPIRNSFIEGEWWLIKKAWENKRLYKGVKVMTWCASCETALAKHELEYENVTEDSIFIKFPVLGKKNEFLILWTTTPWTIPFNLAVMVNPELEYVRAKVDDEVWIVAKGLVGVFVQAVAGKKFTIVEEMKGDKLAGLKYVHPFAEDIPYFKEIAKDAKTAKNLHTVILSEEYVDLSAGSGLVHCAPGCGPEDYEVGQKYSLPPFNNIDERGIFFDMGKFSRLVAKRDDKQFVEELDKKGLLIAQVPVEHEYAHCWRCHNPVVFRTTEQWFMKVEDLRDKIKNANAKVNWVPARSKQDFDAWISSLRDNSVTRQRFWGAPVPIWVCPDCNNTTVIGTIDELKQKAATKVPDDLHKPWIDDVLLNCDRCKQGKMKRIPDVIDVWIDAGTTSWNCLDYPAETELFNKLYPADFILEATEQIRLWFSMLQICSFIAMDKPSYKNVYCHGMILDWQGTKMSKSLGNFISPYEVIDKMGVDVLRYYMCGMTAGENINFSWDDAKQKQRNLVVLWNIANYLLGLASELELNPAKIEEKKIKAKLATEEKYIFSKMNSAIKKATEFFESYSIDKTISVVEELFLDLSRGYVQMIRDKAAVGSKEEKEVVFYTIYKVLLECLKLFAPIAPFVTEKIYQSLKHEFKLETESIHLFDWPKQDEKMIDSKLEEQMIAAQEIITAVMFAREKAGLGVRWPVGHIELVTKDKAVAEALEALGEIIKTQVNVKEIHLHESAPSVEKHIEVDVRGGKLYLNPERTPELEAEGFARELMRKIQSLRKKAGLEKVDRIDLNIVADNELAGMLSVWKDKIQEKVGAVKFEITTAEPKKTHKHVTEEKIKDKKITIGFDVV
jgi:isoleucyl-tRNA synthetase